MACGAISLFQKRPLRLGQVISTVPLSRVALFIRSITNMVTPELMEKQVKTNRLARDKLKLHKTLDVRISLHRVHVIYLPADSLTNPLGPKFLPPMSFVLTDWRGASVCDLDFGCGRSVALRSPVDSIVGNLMILYPLRKADDDPDHGWEIVLPFEAEHVEMLINDPDLGKYFEFCGYEAHAAEPSNEPLPKIGARDKVRGGIGRLKFWVFLNFPV